MKIRQSFLNRMRFLNKKIFNRVTLKFAGASQSPISVIRHIGRRSGTPYATPVIAVPLVDRGLPPWFRFFLLLPWPLPKLFGALLRAANRRDPTITVAMGGTVGVTAVGMFGHSSGWGLVPFAQTLGLIVGGIARKPGVVDDRIEPREILSLTVAFDHDVIDGAPAARFVRRVTELIESGYGLAETDQAALVAMDMSQVEMRVN